MVRTCNYAGCDKKIYAKGLCNGHYCQLRAGLALRPLRQRKMLHTDEHGRVCTSCGAYKTWTDFYVRANGTRHSACKPCQIKANSLTNSKRLGRDVTRAREVSVN